MLLFFHVPYSVAIAAIHLKISFYPNMIPTRRTILVWFLDSQTIDLITYLDVWFDLLDGITNK